VPACFKKGFQCDICLKILSSKSNLKIHQNIHQGVRLSFQCDQCSKCFTSKSSLKRHQNIHPVVKPFQCDPCNKRFTYKSILKKHEQSKSHCIIADTASSNTTVNTPWQCQECLKFFKNKGGLGSHKNKHLRIASLAQSASAEVDQNNNHEATTETPSNIPIEAKANLP
ncbi:unnamed protein product, partial [Meganyctiphanes norvegica]